MKRRNYAELLADDAVDTDVLAGFQKLLTRCPTASDRKELIMAAHDFRALGLTETSLLIQVYQLETA